MIRLQIQNFENLVKSRSGHHEKIKEFYSIPNPWFEDIFEILTLNVSRHYLTSCFVILTLLCLEQGLETPSSSSQSWAEMPLTKKVPKWAGLEKSQPKIISFFNCQQKRAEKRKHEGKDSQATLKRNNTYLLTTYFFL